MLIRNLEETDYDAIISALNEWWGGRPMTDMLPRLFFKHFRDTSFVIEQDNAIAAFIVGFISQADPNQAYVHFTGVNPDYRKRGLGVRLYQTLFAVVKQKGCDTVRLVTSPNNTNSIAFHTHIGFQIEAGTCNINGVAVSANYDGPGEDRVLFIKAL